MGHRLQNIGGLTGQSSGRRNSRATTRITARKTRLQTTGFPAPLVHKNDIFARKPALVAHLSGHLMQGPFSCLR